MVVISIVCVVYIVVYIPAYTCGVSYYYIIYPSVIYVTITAYIVDQKMGYSYGVSIVNPNR